MLKVQEYLQTHTLDELHTEYGIEYSEYQNLICLSYSQIDSPKFNPIVSECRGIVLELNTWKCISYPFHRFYNFGENPSQEHFNFQRAIGMQKLDGSLIQYFNYNGKWLYATRSVIENDSKINLSNKTFKELFYKTLEQYGDVTNKLNPYYSYYFELTALENRVVTIYPRPELHLIMVRNMSNLKELSLKDLYIESDNIGIELPGIVKFDSIEELVKMANSLHTLEEGFVAVNYSRLYDGMNYERVKVKNTSYVNIAHLKDSAARSQRSLVSLVYDGEESEFLIYFPEYQKIVDDIKKKYNEYIFNLNLDIEKCKDYFSKDKKTFALFIEKGFLNTSFLFQMYNKKVTGVKDYFEQIEKNKGRKYLEQYLVDSLKIKEELL